MTSILRILLGAFYFVAIILLCAGGTWIVHRLAHQPSAVFAMCWKPALALGVVALALLCNSTSVGKPTRFISEEVRIRLHESDGRGHPQNKTGIKTPSSLNPANSSYIESKSSAKNGSIYSCSFVEFDGKGDYLDFDQHSAAWQKVRELASEKERLLLVIYCHGWKNNSQSGDVVAFNNFLSRLASSNQTHGKFRVHGVYLAWRGSVFYPDVEKNSDAYKQCLSDFGNEPIVSDAYHTRVPWLTSLPQQLSYWNRKSAAENDVSGVPMARTAFACAEVAKRVQNGGQPNRVFVIGHSFGGLMLEQSIGHASFSLMVDNAPWFGTKEDTEKRVKANPLPFDLVMFVNSAAPSIHAKKMYDYLQGYQDGLTKSGVTGSRAPLFISVTSEGDTATKNAHHWANIAAPLSANMQREYEDVLVGSKGLSVPLAQGYYYQRTPGHNPLLVDHWALVQDNSDPASQPSPLTDAMDLNMDLTVKEPRIFYTQEKPGKSLTSWKLYGIDEPDTSACLTPEIKAWRTVKGAQVKPHAMSDYWIVRVPKAIIKDHCDVWSYPAMDLYASLFRRTLIERKRPADASLEGNPWLQNQGSAAAPKL